MDEVKNATVQLFLGLQERKIRGKLSSDTASAHTVRQESFLRLTGSMP